MTPHGKAWDWGGSVQRQLGRPVLYRGNGEGLGLGPFCTKAAGKALDGQVLYKGSGEGSPTLTCVHIPGLTLTLLTL